MLLTLAMVTALGPLMYRVAYQPLAEASVLVLLIVSVALHFTMVGLGLWYFGAEGSRTPAFSSASFVISDVNIIVQSLLVVTSSLALIGALAIFFGRTLYGKALRATAVNRAGARLVGISPDFAGALTFTLAALLCAFSGVLIGPITTICRRLGFLVGLKGFVGAIIGGLSSYPIALRSPSGRSHRIVFVVLGQRVQGGHRVHADHPGAPVAQPDHDAPRGRRMRLHGAAFAAFVVALSIVPLVAPEFWVTLGNYIGLYSIVALGLVLLTGVAGQTSFGQAAFVGIGAYTTAILATRFGTSPWLALGIGMVITAAVALFLGFITLRMKGHYLPLATIAWGMSLYYVFGNLEMLGGHTGMSGIPALSLFGFELKSEHRYYYLIWELRWRRCGPPTTCSIRGPDAQSAR